MKTQPITPGATGSPIDSAPRVEAPPPPTNPVPIILGIVLAFTIATIVLARRQGNGTIYQRHAAIVGGLVTFAAPFIWSAAENGLARGPTNLGAVFMIATVCSIPGLVVGFFLGTKEPRS